MMTSELCLLRSFHGVKYHGVCVSWFIERPCFQDRASVCLLCWADRRTSRASIMPQTSVLESARKSHGSKWSSNCGKPLSVNRLSCYFYPKRKLGRGESINELRTAETGLPSYFCTLAKGCGAGFCFLVIWREEYLECHHLKSGYSGINLFSAVSLHTLECVSELERMDTKEPPSIYTFVLKTWASSLTQVEQVSVEGTTFIANTHTGQ